MRAYTKVLIIIFFLVAAGLCCVMYFAPKIHNFAEKTSIVEYSEFRIMDEVTAVLVRNETLFLAARTGGSEPLASEGTKVRRGMRIYHINESIPADASEKRYADILENAGDDAGESEGGVVPVTAIVSYYADGYEKRIRPDNIGELTKDIAAALPEQGESLTRGTVIAGEPIYKLADNNVWYMAYWVRSKSINIESYVPDERVTVDLGTTRVTAKIMSITDAGTDKLIVLRSDMYYKDLAKYRKLKVKVIFFEEHEGAVVSNSAIIREHGRDGVYVKQQNGTFKWIPVKVLKENNGRSLIKEGKYYDDEGVEVVTIRYYDEILVDPKAEGF